MKMENANAKITLDYRQAAELLEMFGGEPGQITLVVGTGHGGEGVYAYWDELPEEGTIYLGQPDDEALPAIT